MEKAKANAEHYMQRAGSFSTRGARTGLNLLGWGENETLTRQQQIDAMNARVRQIEDRLAALKAELNSHGGPPELGSEQDALRNEHRELSAEINAVRGGRYGEIPPQILIREMEQHLEPGLLKTFVAEARERLAAAQRARAAAPVMAPEVEQKKALLAQRHALNAQIEAMALELKSQYIADFGAFLERKKSVGRQLNAVNTQINKLRLVEIPDEAGPRVRSLEGYVVDVCKERVTKPVWTILIRGAWSAMQSAAAGANRS